jgi:hypothetical protein
MVRFVSSRMTKPSDKIYRVLSLATDVNDPIFLPDYTKPLEMLFREFISVLITRDAKLDILRFASTKKKSGGPAVPSWTYSLSERVRLGFYLVTTAKRPDFLSSNGGNKLYCEVS